MKFVFIAVLLWVATHGVMVGLENCNLSDAAFLNCFGTIFDTDHNNVVTYAEVVDGLATRVTYSAGLTVDFIMKADLNGDNQLDQPNDWDNANRTFYKDQVSKLMACFACRQNGIAML